VFDNPSQATVVSSKTMLEKGILQHKFLFNHIWKGENYPVYLHPHLLLLLGTSKTLLMVSSFSSSFCFIHSWHLSKEKFQITFRLRRKRIVLRAVEDVTGRTQNQLSFRIGDKILLMEKPKVGRWWKGMHNGQVDRLTLSEASLLCVCANGDVAQAHHLSPPYRSAISRPTTSRTQETLPSSLSRTSRWCPAFSVPSRLQASAPALFGPSCHFCLMCRFMLQGMLEKEWPPVDEAAPLQIGRIWRFNFLPLPFFPQVIVRLLHTGESRFVPALCVCCACVRACVRVYRFLHLNFSSAYRLHWKSGMVVENIRGDAWSLVQVDHGLGTLSVSVRSASPSALQGMQPLHPFSAHYVCHVAELENDRYDLFNRRGSGHPPRLVWGYFH